MTSLVIAEHESGKLNGATHKAVNAALQLGTPVDLLVAGENCAEVAKEGACLQGVERVLLCNSPILAQQLAEPMSALILSIAENYGAILAPATVSGKNILPRVAAVLDVMQVSDITAIIDPTCFERPIYAGNAVQRLRSHDKKQVITVRTTNFESVEETENAAPIEEISPPQTDERVTFKGEALSDAGRPELTSANIVVSGGRALASKEKFDALIIPLADALGGAVGASRAAVDAGYAPNDWQVGQTGKVVAPDLYVACGISGAIQHLAGMKDSKTIVAINKDEEAPIFQVADYGLVADIFDVLPQLTEEIARLKS